MLRQQQSKALVLYDKSCPICRKEMHSILRRDRHQRLHLVDISAAEFRAQQWQFEQAALEAALHVRTREGNWLQGLAAVHYVYQQIGRGWLIAPLRLSLLAPLAERLYLWFARNRYHFSSLLSRNKTTDFCTSCNSK